MQKETLLSHPVPTRPWAKVGIDLFSFKELNYLITADSSGYFEVDRLNSKSISEIIFCQKTQFVGHGIPNIVFYDNNPFLSAEFKRFTAQHAFKHHTSAPRFPQSNGKVESAVKILKRLMEKAIESQADPF